MATVISVVAKQKRCLSILSMPIFHLEGSGYVWIHPQRQIRAYTRCQERTFWKSKDWESTENPICVRTIRMERDVGTAQPMVKFIDEGISITEPSCWARPEMVSGKTVARRLSKKCRRVR